MPDLANVVDDSVLVVAFLVGVVFLLLLAHFLPKEDLGPDPDHKEDWK